jgi:hypothetical protein
MSKNSDLFQILALVLVGMFIPFFISIIINFGINLSNIEGLFKIIITFLYFLLIFGIELIIVYLYFNITNKLANKKINRIKKK